MIKNPTIPTLSDPKLIDSALFEFQTSLAAKLVWLDHAYGKAERFTEVKDKRTIDYPAVYIGGKDYLKVFPDSHIGNFCFFDVEDGQKVNEGRRINKIEFNAGLIVWFDFREVYLADWQTRSIENVKFEVLEAIKSSTLRNSSVRVLQIYERAEKVYQNYTNTEIENQFRMRPYGLFRIDLNIKSNNVCQP